MNRCRQAGRNEVNCFISFQSKIKGENVVRNKIKLKIAGSVVLTAALTAVSAPAIATNEAMLDLLRILRDKGSISADEYDMLRNAALADEEKTQGETADLKREMEKSGDSTANAGWANKVRIKGDIRLRYQYQDEDASISRDRGRVRYRLGIIARPADKLEVGAGLASGSDDQRSTNQSFDDSFSTKNIGLDYAYAEYAFTDSFKAVGGKFKYDDYLWTPTDLIWDSDINPEGASANFILRNSLGDTFLNGGVWVLEEEGGSKNDPNLFYGQLGHKWNSGRLFGALAGSYYNYSDITALGALSRSEGTNTDYRFDSLGLSATLGMTDLLGKDSSLALIGDFIKNTDTSSPQDTGFAVGLKGGKSRWGFKYIYADLEANAWPDFLPDSDRFDGLTGIRGHEFAVSYALMKNVQLGLDYYAVKNTVGNTDQDLLQADVVIKF